MQQFDGILRGPWSLPGIQHLAVADHVTSHLHHTEISALKTGREGRRTKEHGVKVCSLLGGKIK